MIIFRSSSSKGFILLFFFLDLPPTNNVKSGKKINKQKTTPITVMDKNEEEEKKWRRWKRIFEKLIAWKQSCDHHMAYISLTSFHISIIIDENKHFDLLKDLWNIYQNVGWLWKKKKKKNIMRFFFVTKTNFKTEEIGNHGKNLDFFFL